MNIRENLQNAKRFADRRPYNWAPRMGWGRACASLAIAAAFTCMSQENPVANGPVRPDPSAPTATVDKTPKQLQTDDANAKRKKQIADESSKLLTMAMALKAEVDKTTKDTLSLRVIRRAEEIEKLAHSVKEEMKATAGPG